jgi:MFS family permease
MTTQTRSVVAVLSVTFASAAAVVALTTALGKQVYDLTGSELALGLLGLAEFAPNALLVLVTGPLADRYDRRRILALSMTAQALVIAAIAWYAASDPTSATPIFVLVVLFGIARAFGWPALRALPPDVVERERIPWLTIRTSATFQAAMIVGPVLGGFLYAADVTLPYVAVTLLLLAGAATVGLVHVHPTAAGDEAPPAGAIAAGARGGDDQGATSEQIVADATLEIAAEAADGDTALRSRGRGGLREAVAGFVFIRHEPLLLGAISLDLFAVLFGGAVALLPVFAKDVLEVGPAGLGILRAAPAVGALVSALLLTRWPVWRRAGRTLLLFVGLYGASIVVFGLSRLMWLSLIALAAGGAFDMVSVVLRQTILPLTTPDELRGRVTAVEMVFISASNELGAFESGVAAALLGAVPAVVLGGCVTMAIAIGWTRFFPALADVDRLDELRPSGY